MRLNSLVYVPDIRKGKKLCGLALYQIPGLFSQGRFDYRFEFPVESKYGTIEKVQLRWFMNHRTPKSHAWSMSLLLNNIRIDGIDFEQRVNDHRGGICSGWHRHIWDREIESSDRQKECLDQFGPFDEFAEFVLAGCIVLGIELEQKEEPNATGDLPFD